MTQRDKEETYRIVMMLLGLSSIMFLMLGSKLPDCNVIGGVLMGVFYVIPIIRAIRRRIG
jgi:hypothetical protein